MEHPAVMEAAAVGYPDEDMGHVVRAFIVLRPGFAADDKLLDELRAHFAEHAEPQKAPSIYSFVESLPKTATGKVKRAELRTHAL